MRINELTGDGNRLPPPDLTEEDLRIIRNKLASFDIIQYNKREYWNDLDGTIFVTAWKGEQHVSGDIVGHL